MMHCAICTPRSTPSIRPCRRTPHTCINAKHTAHCHGLTMSGTKAHTDACAIAGQSMSLRGTDRIIHWMFSLLSFCLWNQGPQAFRCQRHEREKPPGTMDPTAPQLSLSKKYPGNAKPGLLKAFARVETASLQLMNRRSDGKEAERGLQPGTESKSRREPGLCRTLGELSLCFSPQRDGDSF